VQCVLGSMNAVKCELGPVCTWVYVLCILFTICMVYTVYCIQCEQYKVCVYMYLLVYFYCQIPNILMLHLLVSL